MNKITKFFLIGMGVIIAVAVLLIGYGMFLNSSSESQIALRMASRTLAVQGARAEKRNLGPRLRVARASLSSESMADAVALIDGKITQVYHKRHDMVEAGEPILSLLNEELPTKLSQADGDILRAEAQLHQAESSFARYTRLFARNATSKEKLEDAETQYKQASAVLAQAQAQKDQLLVMQSYQDVTAPLSGELMMLYRSPGSFVQGGTSVALIGDFSKLKFSFDVSDRDAGSHFVRQYEGETLAFTIDEKEIRKVFGTDYGAGNAGAEEEFTAKIVEVAPDFSQPAALRRVTVELDNASRVLEPHVYRDGALHAKAEAQCLAIPADAFTDHERTKVFVIGEGGVLEERAVKTGVDDGEYIEITDGLQEGEIVLTSDKEGMTAGTKVDVSLENS